MGTAYQITCPRCGAERVIDSQRLGWSGGMCQPCRRQEIDRLRPSFVPKEVIDQIVQEMKGKNNVRI